MSGETNTESAAVIRSVPTAGARAGAVASVVAGQAIFLAALGMLPTLRAIWSYSGFVTQDGPAHLYNAQILLESLKHGDASPYARAFAPQWRILPNWAGHLVQMGLLGALPPLAAHRVMLTLTLISPVAAALWLRWRVSGPRGFVRATFVILLLGINLPWLLGFHSFLLGVAIGLITIGTWWGSRGSRGVTWARTSVVAALLVVGFFCHPISLGLTVAALLALPFSFGKRESGARLRASVVAMVPLVPLGLAYVSQIGHGGAIHPMWETSGFPWRPSAWPAQFFWSDPLTLSRKDRLPFVESTSRIYALGAPVFWAAIGLALCVAAVWIERRSEVDSKRNRIWLALLFVLLFGGAIAPDTLGPSHGNYLPQRVVLFGLFLLGASLPLSGRITGAGRVCRDIGTGMVVVALVLQVLFIQDYARRSNRFTREFLAAGSFVGRDQRVATLLINPRGPYRSNPLLHVDNLLGIGSGNIMWSNYESGHYYFPVQVREDVPHPPVGEFERISLLDDPRDRDRRARDWALLLEAHRGEIDVVVMRGQDDALDRATAVYYDLIYDLPGSAVRVWKRRREGAN